MVKNALKAYYNAETYGDLIDAAAKTLVAAIHAKMPKEKKSCSLLLGLIAKEMGGYMQFKELKLGDVFIKEGSSQLLIKTGNKKAIALFLGLSYVFFAVGFYGDEPVIKQRIKSLDFEADL